MEIDESNGEATVLNLGHIKGNMDRIYLRKE